MYMMATIRNHLTELILWTLFLQGTLYPVIIRIYLIAIIPPLAVKLFKYAYQILFLEHRHCVCIILESISYAGVKTLRVKK